jgi:hypothetical protein
MSENRLLHALSLVQDRYIVESAPGQTPPKEHPWLKWAAIAACFCILVGALFINSSTLFRRYQRISFGGNTLGEKFEHSISEDTVIIGAADVTFPAQFSVYAIKEHNISQQEYLQILEALNLPERAHSVHMDGNHVDYAFASYLGGSRKPVTQTDEEIVEAAKAVFAQFPFTDGEYECIGVRNRITRRGPEKDEDLRVGVQFCRVIDGFRVTPSEYTLYFDGDGFVGFALDLYDYTKQGTMDLVTIEEANNRLTTPDDFSIENYDGSLNGVSKLEVEEVRIRLVNQYSNGCTILQPIYYYTGNMTLKSGEERRFSAKIIAIPEIYTYEKP